MPNDRGRQSSQRKCNNTRRTSRNSLPHTTIADSTPYLLRHFRLSHPRSPAEALVSSPKTPTTRNLRHETSPCAADTHQNRRRYHPISYNVHHRRHSSTGIRYPKYTEIHLSYRYPPSAPHERTRAPIPRHHRHWHAVMLSCFTITFEMQCACEHVHCVIRGITHAHIINPFCPAWRAVHMLSFSIYAKTNCTL